MKYRHHGCSAGAQLPEPTQDTPVEPEVQPEPPKPHYIETWKEEQERQIASQRLRIEHVNEAYREHFDAIVAVVADMHPYVHINDVAYTWKSTMMLQVTFRPSAVSEVTAALRVIRTAGYRIVRCFVDGSGTLKWWVMEKADLRIVGGKFTVELNAYFAVEDAEGKTDRPAVCRMVKVGEEPQPPRPIYKMVCDGNEDPATLPSESEPDVAVSSVNGPSVD
jgi:hypothetical protein